MEIARGFAGRSTLALLLLGLTAGLTPAQPPVSAVQPRRDLPAILASRQLLASHHLSVGDLVELSNDPSGASPRRFRIAGVYEPMPDPIRLTSDRLEVRLHLPDLLDLTADPHDPQAADPLSAINVKLTRPDDAAGFAEELSARLPAVAVRPSRGAEGEGNPFVVLGRFHLAIASLTVTTSAVFLLALMVLLADERREVVGTLRLIGLTRGRVLGQVLLEGALIAGAGAAFGVGLAALTQGAFNSYFQWRYDTSLVFVRITPAIAWRTVAVAMPLGMAASVLASWALVRSETLKLVRR
ncbi:MAG: FtsX-like permease family protein [Acidobacteria bacterium]|nr:FtsX-like permease family protein [Acidobacteriota bacterium]